MGLFGFNWNFFKPQEDIFGKRSPLWDKVRTEHLKKEKECQCCLRKINLEVHHIIPFNLRPDLELDPTNLITLCANNCHLLVGHLMNFRSYNENVKEDCRIIREKIKNRP